MGDATLQCVEELTGNLVCHRRRRSKRRDASQKSKEEKDKLHHDTVAEKGFKDSVKLAMCGFRSL